MRPGRWAGLAVSAVLAGAAMATVSCTPVPGDSGGDGGTSATVATAPAATTPATATSVVTDPPIAAAPATAVPTTADTDTADPVVTDPPIAGDPDTTAPLVTVPPTTKAPTAAVPRDTDPPTPAAAPQTWWTPEQGMSWQVQLSGGLDTSVRAGIYDVDGVDTPSEQLAGAKAQGAKLVCYFNAGAWEPWRADAGVFGPELLGDDMDGWPDERWLDVRQREALLPIMAARMDNCKDRGFDAVDPDNVDGYDNATGFPLTREDQLAYLRELAAVAHARGLGFGLKNSVDLVDALVHDIDFAVNEQCLEYRECDAYAPLLAAGKPVVVLEYSPVPQRVCAAVPHGMEVLFKDLDLGPGRTTC